jgi:2-dehydropantoate 2-reductase
VVGGLCKIVAERTAPGVVRHGGAEPYVAFAELDRRRSERCERLRAAFARGGVHAEVPADIHAAMWEKFLFIAPASAVGAAARAPFGDLRAVPASRTLLRQAMEEVLAVARARGIALDDGVVPRTLAFIDSLPPDSTPSMQRDLAAGRPSELEAQVGAVRRLGREAGVAAPIHEVLYACLLPLELKARGKL